MRTLIIACIVAVSTALSFAAPSQAGGYYGGGNDGYYGGGYSQVDHYYGHKRRHYKRTYYEPNCWIKKIRKYDHYGNLVVKRIRVCD